MRPGPFVLGSSGAATMASGLAMLRLTLNPPTPSELPPSAERDLVHDPALAPLRRDAWRAVQATAVGAAAVLSAVLWAQSD